MTEHRQNIRILRFADQDDDEALRPLTPEERIHAVWPLTLDAWAFTGEKLDQLRLRRC